MGATTPHADVDATAEELPDEPVHSTAPVPATSTALAPRTRRSEVIRPLDLGQLVESFEAYQELLPRLLRDSDYQEAEQGKRFVKKSGWRKIATAFDLDVQIISEVVERDENGRILRSKTTARATSPSGRVMDGDGYCTIDEFTGRRAHNPKLENDLRGTAATRAKNRAISDLVGMGEVSAEEVAAGGGGSVALPAWAAGIDREATARLRRALAYLLDDEPRGPRVEQVGFEITEACGGIIPAAVLDAVRRVAIVAKRHDDARAAGGASGEGEDVTEAARAAEALASEHGDTPVDEPPARAATVPTPDNLPQDPAKRIAALRELGCRCDEPLKQATWIIECPIAEHSRGSDDIPF